MGIEKRKPAKVEKARIAHDAEALSRMGAKGGRIAAENRAKRVAEDAMFDEEFANRKIADMESVARERGDHLLPEQDR